MLGLNRPLPPALLPALLATSVVLAYLPSLAGGFLSYDDPWLIEANPVLRWEAARAVRAIWTDFSFETRYGLGGEYLPLRDLSLWLEGRLWGLEPRPLRLTQLALYVGAVLLLRSALRRTLANLPGGLLMAEVAAWLFALHPVHVESVAWLAGRKDVLALLFVAAALRAYSGDSRHRAWAVPALMLAAHLSKGASVTAGGLLLAQDLLLRRRPAWVALSGSAAVAVAATAAHVHVGHLIGVTTEPAGGSRWTAAITMGPVWLRYLGLLVWPFSGLSVVHEVPVRTSWDAPAVAGWALLSAWGLLGAWEAVTRARPLLLAAWLWCVVPLLPVSQILFPLQNLMADRYLLYSALSPCLLVAGAVIRRPRAGPALASAVAAALAFATAHRSALFSDSLALFSDARAKAPGSPVPPYQIAQALEERGEEGRAMALYAEALDLSPPRSEVGRRATNNLAKLLAREGRLEEAERLLRRGRQAWPQDPKVLGNLVKVLLRRGQHEEAGRLAQELAERFPRYAAEQLPEPRPGALSP